MALNVIANGANAATTFFYEIPVASKNFTIDFKNLNIVGSPTYTIKCSNVSGNESDYMTFDDVFIDLDASDGSEITNFGFKFLGISYVANGATGTYDIYLNE